MKYKNIILGNGEVANAIKPYLRGVVKTYDKGEWEHINASSVESDTGVILLHVCIPFCSSFTKTVGNAIKSFAPHVTIIHSTVKDGTTEKIKAESVLYSPVNGRHGDNFKHNIKNYPKMFAGAAYVYDMCKYAFKMKTVLMSPIYADLEYAKVMCTNYMYWCLAFEKIMHADCEIKGIDFDIAYTQWNEIYNKGIKKKHKSWQRPIYKHDDSKHVGGHCLRPNIHLTDNFITKVLKEYERLLK